MIARAAVTSAAGQTDTSRERDQRKRRETTRTRSKAGYAVPTARAKMLPSAVNRVGPRTKYQLKVTMPVRMSMLSRTARQRLWTEPDDPGNCRMPSSNKGYEQRYPASAQEGKGGWWAMSS